MPLNIRTEDSEDLELRIYNLDADAWFSYPTFDSENNLWQFSVPINQQTALRIRASALIT